MGGGRRLCEVQEGWDRREEQREGEGGKREGVAKVSSELETGGGGGGGATVQEKCKTAEIESDGEGVGGREKGEGEILLEGETEKGGVYEGEYREKESRSVR